MTRRTAYGESVCWITPFDNRTAVEQWLPLGHGDPEWLWRHEALVFGARYLDEHVPAKVQMINGTTGT
jgi:hypothetical protein